MFVPDCIQVATLRVLKMAFSRGKRERFLTHINSHKHLATSEIAQGSNFIIFTLTNKNFIAVVQGTWERNTESK